MLITQLKKLRMRELLLIAFIIFIIIPFLALALIYIGVSQNYVKKTYGEYLVQTIDAVQEQIDDSYDRFVDGTMNFYHNGMVGLLEQDVITEKEELLIQSKLEDIINSYSGSVSSVFLMYRGKSYVTGGRYQDLVELVAPYQQEIQEKRGRHIWIGPKQLIPKSKSGKKLILAKSLNGVKEKNIAQVYLVVDVEEFVDFFDRNELKGMSQYLFNARQELVYSANIPEDEENIHLETEQKNGYRIINVKRVNYLEVHYQSAKTGWVVDIRVPMKILLRDFELIKITFWILAGVYIGFLVAMLILMEKYIVFPVRKLTDHMDDFAEGTFDVEVQAPAIGELRRLNRHFNKMTVRIVDLMKRNEQEVKEKNEFKMQTLRAQLSPHFMYNTLNTIKWMAVINKQQNIQNLTEALIQLLMSHARGKEERYTLEDEIQLIQNYSIIQKSRFMNFDIQFQIGEEVKECKMIKFLLQPIVENAILHGFARGKKRRGVICVTALRKEELYICIEDNGNGFDVEAWEQAEKKIDESHTHIAIENIRQIIILEYGCDYGIVIHSELGIGTRVEYRLPLLYNDTISVEDKGESV